MTSPCLFLLVSTPFSYYNKEDKQFLYVKSLLLAIQISFYFHCGCFFKIGSGWQYHHC
jgi:hypothetical protein